MTGILLVDKPEGVSSAGVIRLLKPRLGRSKVGHLGTLDPFASGLLPLCIGEATKVARYLLVERKAYTGVIRLGRSTDTMDGTGATVTTAPVPAIAPDQLAAVATAFTGPQEQVPPMFSALKRDGVPLYKLARRGVEVERTPRAIEIYTLTLTLTAPDAIAFAVECSKGTYVRVLGADIAERLGTVGHLEALRRTGVGAFRVDDALSAEAVRDGTGALPLIPIRRALGSLRGFHVPAQGRMALARGQQDALAVLPGPVRPDETALVLDEGDDVGAVIEASEQGGWRVVRVLGAG